MLFLGVFSACSILVLNNFYFNEVALIQEEFGPRTQACRKDNHQESW